MSWELLWALSLAPQVVLWGVSGRSQIGLAASCHLAVALLAGVLNYACPGVLLASLTALLCGVLCKPRLAQAS